MTDFNWPYNAYGCSIPKEDAINQGCISWSVAAILHDSVVVVVLSTGNLSIDDGTPGRRRPEVGLSHLRVLRMSVFVNQSSTFCRRRNLTENFVLLKTKAKALSLKLFSQVLYSYLRSCVPGRVIERGYITLKCVFSSFCGDISEKTEKTYATNNCRS